MATGTSSPTTSLARTWSCETSRKIAHDYIAKVEARLEALRLFLSRGRNADVIREAHEAVELLLKGALRYEFT
jgi:HEPN domain-containing protein